MNQIKFALLAPLAMAVLLSGCDNAKQTLSDIGEALDKEYNFPQVPMQFEPDSYVIMDGNRTRIQGFDDCLKEPRGIVMEMLFGPDNSPEDGCVVVKPDTASVEIMYFPDGRPIPETWTVEHPRKHVIALRRPNGEYILDVRSVE
jgi:hypothetical protein